MAYDVYIKTKEQLKDYIIRKLGGGVISTIAVTDDQLEDIINDVLEMYVQNAYAGVLERYLPLEIQADKSSYTLPYNIFAVLEVKSLESGGIISGLPTAPFSIQQFIASDIYRGSGKIDFLTYEMVNQLLSTMDIVMSNKSTFDFNCVSKELHLFQRPTVTQMSMIHCYVKNVPVDVDNGSGVFVETSNIYSELMVRKLATEHARKQWGHNLMLYGGTTMPNGVTINAEAILNEANTNLEKLEIEFYDKYCLPVDIFIG